MHIGIDNPATNLRVNSHLLLPLHAIAHVIYSLLINKPGNPDMYIHTQAGRSLQTYLKLGQSSSWEDKVTCFRGLQTLFENNSITPSLASKHHPNNL